MLGALSSVAVLAALAATVPTAHAVKLSGYPSLDVAPPTDDAWTAKFAASANDGPFEPDVGKCTSAHVWGVTYDDGPSPATTVVLDALKAKGKKATFFVVGSRVVENPELVLRAFQEGHQIASHTWSHRVLKDLSDADVVAELMWSGKVIEEVTGQFPRFFRPPEGEINDRVRRIANAMGMRAILWSHDTLDWQMNDGSQSAESVTNTVKSWIEQKPAGPLSLEHDLTESCAAIAPSLLDMILAAGYDVQPAATCFGDNSFYQSNPLGTPSKGPMTASPSSTPVPVADNAQGDHNSGSNAPDASDSDGSASGSNSTSTDNGGLNSASTNPNIVLSKSAAAPAVSLSAMAALVATATSFYLFL